MSTLLVVSLIIAGILLLLVELLIVPGVGAAGFAGLACFGAACYFSFDRFGVLTGSIVTAVLSLSLLALLIYVLRAKTWKRFELKEEIKATVAPASCPLNPGDRGATETRLAPMGSARFGNGSFEVKSETNDMVAPGTAVEVVRIEDNKIIVKPLEK